MSKEFNDTGLCVPERHFMADITFQLDAITALIEKGKYFTISRPRQYGKTTTQYMLWRRFRERKDYRVIQVSFEGIASDDYASQAAFISSFLDQLENFALGTDYSRLLELTEKYRGTDRLSRLGRFITDLTKGEKVVLMIDEVDKSSNNRLFLDFLALLRDKYLGQAAERDFTFQSVILAGLYDVKNLKHKIRPEEKSKFNSPWNIAIDFDVDMNLNRDSIIGMLQDYAAERKVIMDAPAVAERLLYHTSGYPFLVSRLCKIMDEVLELGSEWRVTDVDRAVARILTEENTNFGSLFKNLENNSELYQIVKDIVLDAKRIAFNTDNPLVKLGALHGIFRANDCVRIHNRIYEQRIFNYITSRLETERLTQGFNVPAIREFCIKPDGSLNFDNVLLKFQEFMKRQYSKWDEEFLEHHGRLVFLAFLKPIINGRGHDFKEAQTSEEKRMDVVVVFQDQKFVVELKIWRGPGAHADGLKQLADYLDRENMSSGFLLIFDFRKEDSHRGQTERLTTMGKEIFAVWV